MTRAQHSPPLNFRTLEDVVEVVRADGGRLSVPRRLILETLFAHPEPVSAESISRSLQLELTSVYRNLEKLEDMGVVRHVHLGHGPGLYSLVGRGSREYLVCERCEGVTPVQPAELERIRAAIREAFGFEADFGHFPILGVCANCAHEHVNEHRHGNVVHSHAHPHAEHVDHEHDH